jgi:hypothetical protein
MTAARPTPSTGRPGHLAAALALLLAAGCGSSKSSTPRATPGKPTPGAPVVVDAAGGTVAGPAGVTVTVPPGATAAPVTITASSAGADAPAPPPDANVVVPAISLTPHGAAFARPVAIELPVPVAAIPEGHRGVVLKAEVGGEWTWLSSFDRGATSARVVVSDFSFVIVVAVPAPTTVLLTPLTLQLAAGETLPLPANGRPQLLTFDVLNWYPGDCGFGQPAMQTVSFNAVDSGGTTLDTGVGAAGYRELVSIVRVATAYSTCYDHRPPFAHPGEGPGPVGYSVSLEFVCPPSFRILDRTPPIVFSHTPGPRYDTLGTGPFPDVVARAGTRPALSIAVLGGPCNYEDGRVDVEWQRSDDGGGSWQAVGKSYRGDAGGYPNMFSYQFRVNSFTPPALQASDDGALLRAVACYTPPGGTLDCAFSRAARLTVTGDAPPTFTAQPADALVSEGATATFSAAAAGAPPPTIRWQSSAPGTGVWTDIAGAASAAYTTPPAALADTGTRYRAVATNAVGTATSEPAALSVGVASVPPVIVAQPVGLTVGAGAPATLAVDATGTAPLAYQWAKDGAPIAGATAAVYAIAATVAADAGLYTVTVSNGANPPAVSTPARLTVVLAPAIVTQPAAVTVNAGQAATFGVTATGIRTLSYQWLKNGVAIPGATGPLYATPPAVLADSGAVYSVVISNPAGTVVSDGAQLTVVAPPAPGIGSVTPSHGPTFGGTAIAIAGTGFQPGATVTVGGAAATSVAFVSPTSLTAVTPAGAAGAADVVVKNPDAQTGAGAFTYELVTLAVSSASPAPASNGNPAASTSVSVLFTSPLDCGAITGGALQVSEAGTPVAGTATCAGSTLTFAPTDALPTSTTLSGHVIPSVKSLAGATLGTAYDWSFGMAPWTRQVGSTAFDSARAVAIGPAGDVHLVAQTMGAVDGTALTGIIDSFAVKYAPSGAKLWTRNLGVAGAITTANGGAVDASGNLYVVGSTSGNLDGNTVSGTSDAFVAKYDASGTKLWTKLYGSSAADQATAVAVDGSGNVYVVGATGGSMSGASAGLDDLFVLKLDATGAVLWTRQLGSTQVDQAKAVGVDGSGNVYAAGVTFGGLDGNTAAGPNTTGDGFLVKYDATGAKQWTRQFGTAVDEAAVALAVDPSGNAYVGGRTDGALDGTTTTGNGDCFVVKYDATGAKQWTWQLGSTSLDAVSGLAIDRAGGVLGAGGTNGVMEAGASNGGGTNQLLFSLTAAGAVRWLHQRESAAGAVDTATAVAATPAGDVIAAGNTDHGLDGIATLGGLDAYLVKLTAAGARR